MKKILLTFDYELYFGAYSGTQEKSIIHPTQRVLEVLNKYHIKGTFFVDAGYLLKLEFYKEHYPNLSQDHATLLQQIQRLVVEGHEIQLHIHPHWEDSFYDGQKWVINTSRYRLHDFTKEEIEEIVARYKRVLEQFTPHPIFVFRAGGWCLQPFNLLKEALQKHHIYFDSTVYHGGKNKSQTHYFDFTQAPKMPKWRFDSDPLKPKPQGFFTEIPISSYRLSPWFFWKFLYHKKFGGEKHRVFGDGIAAGGSKLDKVRMLTSSTHSVVSMDGYKSSFLWDAYEAFLRDETEENFVVIGHPKAMSEYSLAKLERFLSKSQNRDYITYKELDNALPNHQSL